eukprot:TRINITY_DN17064_c0_g1_i1.p1 TRINITY_DN17064_c0_g1~~TRINITY_DN17064_c0_g1_i1.p1  ORF type:complete len:435 (+),score=94.01 TRINITY_DN17064_c0_g1_i1:23-1306(+)
MEVTAHFRQSGESRVVSILPTETVGSLRAKILGEFRADVEYPGVAVLQLKGSDTSLGSDGTEIAGCGLESGGDVELAYDTRAAVFDNGSTEVRAGFAGNRNPGAVFPSRVWHSNDGAETRCGHAIEAGMRAKYPIEYGMVTNWDDMTLLWKHALSELDTPSTGRPLLMSGPAPCPKANREKMTQLAFEELNAPAMCTMPSACMAAAAAGCTTGIVVDSSSSGTTVIPVYEGHTLQACLQRPAPGGNEVTGALASSIMASLGDKAQGGVSMSQVHSLAEDCKKRMCYVRTDDSPATPRQCTLPDGTELSLATQRHTAAECLFDASDGMNVDSALGRVCRSLPDLKPLLCENIIVTGGTSQLPGFCDRLTAVAQANGIAFGTVHHQGDQLSNWRGGAIIAEHSSFAGQCITADEYDEYGPALVHRKCPY